LRRVIFLFLDGVGFGADDPAVNPLAAHTYPTLARLLDGHAPISSTGRLSTAWAELVPVDACLGVAGRPQSATGQAAIITGINAPQRLGEHYGPRPDARVRAVVDEGNLFARLREQGRSGYYCNGYPDRFFAAVARGKRLLSVNPYAAQQAGQPLPTYDDLAAGRALSADFTGAGWRNDLGYTDAPLYTPQEAGRQLAQIAADHAFTYFEHWQTDLLGHHRELERAVANFVTIDGVLAGLLEAVDLEETLVLVGSDHGNVEDCSHSRHTRNPALGMLLGAGRKEYAAHLHSLTDWAPIILGHLGESTP
jgi:hypothetical protein